MPKVVNNILLQGLRGTLGGQLVLRRGRGGQTIVSAKPVFDPNREFTPAQKAHQHAFREASAYAKSARGEQVYLTKAEQTGRSPYNLAVADWFHKPEIVELDVTAWNGGAGQPIRIKAVDDVQISRVMVVIRDGNGTVLEQGIADPLDALWWSYVTTVPADGSRRLEVTAIDLPGNQVQTSWQSQQSSRPPS